MHDLFLAQKILDEILSFAQENKIKKITKIVVEIGKIEDHDEEINHSNFKFNLTALARNTLASGAKIVVKKVNRRGYYKIKKIDGLVS